MLKGGWGWVPRVPALTLWRSHGLCPLPGLHAILTWDAVCLGLCGHPCRVSQLCSITGTYFSQIWELQVQCQSGSMIGFSLMSLFLLSSGARREKGLWFLHSLTPVTSSTPSHLLEYRHLGCQIVHLWIFGVHRQSFPNCSSPTVQSLPTVWI